MGQVITQVDAFTNERFSDNPASTCVLARPALEQWMQGLAREMSLLETVFLFPPWRGGRLRPAVVAQKIAVVFYGHATRAGVHVLCEGAHLQVEGHHQPESDGEDVAAWCDEELVSSVEEEAVRCHDAGGFESDRAYLVSTLIVYVGIRHDQ